MATTVGVTVLFTDVVGSTELATRLGADGAERVRRSHFALVRGRIAAHGGTEVKNLGDGIMAVFPSSADALDAATAIQQTLARTTGDEPDALAMRIGVAAGDCTAADGDYFGEPVVVGVLRWAPPTRSAHSRVLGLLDRLADDV
ncbi:MAG: adenylate/guanylate cyclase domain-containing protein [Actinomycetota bacterium]